MIRAPRPSQLPAAPVVQIEAARVIEERAEPTQVVRLWSAKAIAARWCVSRMFAYRLHRSGRLPGYRVAGSLRFLEADLLVLLREAGVPLEEKS